MDFIPQIRTDNEKIQFAGYSLKCVIYTRISKLNVIIYKLNFLIFAPIN